MRFPAEASDKNIEFIYDPFHFCLIVQVDQEE